ncbi:hypothetical protein EI94DRAFT_1703485 [Lactarius quietus]|nr:hypothetical protein EI94DRAFT_1703485 [Lactarius quietus]
MGKHSMTHKARPSNGSKPRIHVENVVLNLHNESLEKAYNKLVASHATAPNMVMEDLEEPTPSEDCANYPNITYCNSRVVDRGKVRKISTEAKSQWLALCKKYGDIGLPWTNVSPNYQLEFFVKMEYKFPLLHLCNGHYKTEAVAFNDYLHWHSKNKFEYMHRLKMTTTSHSKTKTQTMSKSESDTDADSEVNQSQKRRQSSRSVSLQKLQCRKMAQEEDSDEDNKDKDKDNDDKDNDKDNDDDKDEDDKNKDDNKGKEDKEVDELMEDGEVTGGIDADHAPMSSIQCNPPHSVSSAQSSVKPKPCPAHAGAPIAPSPADTPIPIPKQNSVTPQATPTEVMPPEATPTVATPPEATPTVATPPEATLLMATPLRATTPGQITVTSEVMQASAKATNETHKQQELDRKGAAELSSVRAYGHTWNHADDPI